MVPAFDSLSVGLSDTVFELCDSPRPSPNGDLVLFQTLEKIEDMAVSLIREEWLLDPSQKDLSGDNRPENYRSTFSLGKESSDYCQLRFFVCFYVHLAVSFLKDIVEFELRIRERDTALRLLEV